MRILNVNSGASGQDRTARAVARAAAVLAIGAALLAAAGAEARTVGPDSAGYSASDATTYTFQDISTTGTRVLVDVDDQVVNAPIGFTFNFYGGAYTGATLSSNGVISFGGGTSQYSNYDLTQNQVTGGPSIFTYWDDLYTRTSSNPLAGVYYQTIGSVGDRQFIVQTIANAYGASQSASINFQTVLSEANGSVLMRYAATSFGNGQDAGASATVGIQGFHVLGQYVQWSYDTPGSILADSSICFSRDGSCAAPIVGGVPEPTTWAMMIGGMSVVGGSVRHRRQRTASLA